MKKIKSHYDNLQVQETASIDVIKGAYKHLIQKWHPDKHPKDRAKAERITKFLNDAFYVLSDPIKRKAHDEWIASQRFADKQHNEKTESARSSNKSNHNQEAEQKDNSEHVSSKVDVSVTKPANKQYISLFVAATIGLAYVYTLLYGSNSIGPFIQVAKNNSDMLAIALGAIVGVALFPLLIMKFANNSAGWVALMFCLVFSYYGKIKHIDQIKVALVTTTANTNNVTIPTNDSATADVAIDTGTVFTNKLALQTQFAEQGNAQAQSFLCRIYLNAESVPQDNSLAFKWCSYAAEQGDANAQFNLGMMYANGEGVTKDDSKAFKWFAKAAEQGNAYAQYNVGWMYKMGNGVPKDISLAVKWFAKAAEQGNMSGQYELGLRYASGEGLPKDATKSFYWLTKAAEQGEPGASYDLQKMYDNGEVLPILAEQGIALEANPKKNIMPFITPDVLTGRPKDSNSGVLMSDVEVINWYCKYGKEVFTFSELGAYVKSVQDILNSPRAEICVSEEAEKLTDQ